MRVRETGYISGGAHGSSHSCEVTLTEHDLHDKVGSKNSFACRISQREARRSRKCVPPQCVPRYTRSMVGCHRTRCTGYQPVLVFFLKFLLRGRAIRRPITAL